MAAIVAPQQMSTGAINSMLKQSQFGSDGESWGGMFGGLDVSTGAFASLSEAGVDALNANLATVSLGAIFGVRKSGVGQFLFRGVEMSFIFGGEDGDMEQQASDVAGGISAMEAEAAGMPGLYDGGGGGGDASASGSGGGGGDASGGGGDSSSEMGAARPHEFGMTFEQSAMGRMAGGESMGRGSLGGLSPDATPSMGIDRGQNMSL